MGRAPCCEKVGLKKGPWTPQEDQLLINYVNNFGHSNWRALPKLAGLLRCGKSCRLRWINYLKPDIKRGNFTPEEEDTIINLHHMLGNRWSAIAARLPGRTDNEIKNVWHTHLKKRLPQHQHMNHKQPKPKHKKEQQKQQQPTTTTPLSPSNSHTLSSTSTSSTNVNVHESPAPENNGTLVATDDQDFWSEVDQQFQFLLSPLELDSTPPQVQVDSSSNSTMSHVGMDFWYHVYTEAEHFSHLPHL